MGLATLNQDEQKFRELLLYISAKSVNDEKFGATKLNKLLFVCDLLAYGKFGKPMTGVEYVKRKLGPVPRRLPAIREDMINNGELAIEVRPYTCYEQKRTVILRKPDLSRFLAEEIVLVDNVIDMFSQANATEISEWSHGLCGWAIASDDTKIPYQAVFLSDRKMTAYEAEHGRQLALENNWDVFA